MRAHYLKDLIISSEYLISGDDLHHLVNVVRIEEGETLLLLNGRGLSVTTEVVKVSKKELRLKRLQDSIQELPYNFHLALAMPKREALELALKEATEIGFRTIYLIKSDRSQMKFPDEERLGKLLVSALEQSNAPWLPEVKYMDWKEIPWEEMNSVFLMDSQTDADSALESNLKGNLLLVIGPEGGFSSEEISYFHSKQRLKVIHLPTPILRTPTALAVGAGMMIQSLLK
jgi:16S rRNA (uracil1498-N3)-methyltransferase